jgi:prephenate dehydrogenase
MQSIEEVAILGVGLIGGSLGRAWKKHLPELRVIGYDRPGVLDQPAALEAIDETAASIQEAVDTADVVVLATPLRVIPKLLEEAAPHLKPGAIVTDVGSVKHPIARVAREVCSAENPFIGGHPMAGAEEDGIAHADAFLFENATYVLCPPPSTSTADLPEVYDSFIELIEATGARVRIMEAPRHDEVAARVSHLPQLLAVTLMNEAIVANDEDDTVLQLAAGGFRDMTRIASSPFDLWKDILKSNAPHIRAVLEDFTAALDEIQQSLRSDQVERLREAFERARDSREEIPKDTKGFLHPLSEIYVYAEDRPGFLTELTGVLYEAGLNIKDIELLKIREGTGGAFRMGFSSDSEADRAVQALRHADYTAYRL